MNASKYSAQHAQEQALHHLKRALHWLDQADEVKAPPYIQMAIDMLESVDQNAKALILRP